MSLSRQISKTFMGLTRFLRVVGTPDRATEKSGRHETTIADASQPYRWYDSLTLPRPISRCIMPQDSLRLGDKEEVTPFMASINEECV